MHTFDLNLQDIAKMEGKASLNVSIKDDKVEKVQFAISEFKRFYTQAVRGKDVLAIAQLTARICGTCSNAHLLCALACVENALGIRVSKQTTLLRKLVNYGLIIRDHALHLYVFALPDMLGIDNILDLDENKPEEHELLDDCFAIKAAGNNLGKTIGGRSVHAPNLTVGGFTQVPDQKMIPMLIKQLEEVRPAVLRTIVLFQNCQFTLVQNIDFVAQVSSDFSFLNGDIRSTNGMLVRQQEYADHLEHVVIPYSQASGYKIMEKPYMVGALARINLGKTYLHPKTQKDAANALALFPSQNIYHNNLAQAIEILHAVDGSIAILQSLTLSLEQPTPLIRKAGVGVAAIEAPRGTLFYKLGISDQGKAETVQIIVPTGQNQIGIEKSIYEFLLPNVNKDKDYLVQQIEQIVRAYDPCMSCASHFLKVKWKKKSS